MGIFDFFRGRSKKKEKLKPPKTVALPKPKEGTERRFREVKAKEARKQPRARKSKGINIGKLRRGVKREIKLIKRGQPNRTDEQRIFREIASGGSVNRAWGTGENLPKLNHDLNPRQRGDKETGKLFGLE